MTIISFTVNAAAVAVDTDPVRPLLDVLRGDLGLTGTKHGDLEAAFAISGVVGRSHQDRGRDEGGGD